MQTERKGTGRSALGLLAIGVLIVALIAALAWVFTQPGFLESFVNVLLVAVIVIVILAVIAVIAYGVLGLAFYATKGEIVQTGVDHSLDDIHAVEGRTLDDDGNRISDEKE